MKLTFASKTFTPRTFRCVTIGGPVVLGPYRCDEAESTGAGAAAGEEFSTGAAIGQDFHPGAEAGQA